MICWAYVSLAFFLGIVVGVAIREYAERLWEWPRPQEGYEWTFGSDGEVQEWRSGNAAGEPSPTS